MCLLRFRYKGGGRFYIPIMGLSVLAALLYFSQAPPVAGSAQAAQANHGNIIFILFSYLVYTIRRGGEAA